MREYIVIYERGGEGEENWGAYVPDLPGCVTTGDTLEEARTQIHDAITGYLATLKEAGIPIPEPSTQVGSIKIAA